jgi:hypothetical protein
VALPTYQLPVKQGKVHDCLMKKVQKPESTPGLGRRKPRATVSGAIAELQRHRTDEWAWQAIGRMLERVVDGIIRGRLL